MPVVDFPIDQVDMDKSGQIVHRVGALRDLSAAYTKGTTTNVECSGRNTDCTNKTNCERTDNSGCDNQGECGNTEGPIE